MTTHDFKVRIEFDWLMNHPDVREFEESVGSAFVIPPFETLGLQVDPPIHTSKREVDIGVRYGAAETTVVRVEGHGHGKVDHDAFMLVRVPSA